MTSSSKRRGSSVGLAALITLATVLSLAPRAEAFCRSTTCTTADCERDFEGCKVSGTPLQWPSSCVSVSLQRDGTVNMPFAEFERVAIASIISWTDVPCASGGNANIAFSQSPNVSCHQAEYNTSGANANVLMWQDNRWDYQGVDNTLAKTTVTFDPDTGEILDADIEMNHAFNEYTTDDTDVTYDLQAILTHELGHFVGLDHSDDGLATMNARYDRGSIDGRTIEADDVDAICAAYPAGRNATCDTEPDGGFGEECGQDPGDDGGCDCRLGPGMGAADPKPFGAWLSLAAFAWLTTSRRRRR